ncbi:MFS transporter [Pseudonocardia sp. WMMC193]|nr:MFS transporter [Pseudonocardia sp. WMMC193]MCF7552685.1 MFS transporter [Pseudonocardia sp. WMMC193]
MIRTLSQYRSFPRSVQLLLLNQLTINVGFYMLIPYLADHLSQGLGLATWLVGLILGVRNFSQQGMFLIGGSLADRYGYKPLIVAGCALRTAGFALLGLVDNVPALIAASAATGFAGALFNPAVRAYLAQDSGERRVEAFALFSVFYQTGILIGPLVGLALTGLAFSITCLVAAGVFALLTMLQLRALPARRGDDPQQGEDSTGGASAVLRQWAQVASSRGFLLFSLAMIGSYVLSFQVYLALPLQARAIALAAVDPTVVVAGVFAVSGGVTIAAQMGVTAWCRAHLGPGRALSRGLLVLALAFVPILLSELLLGVLPSLARSTAGPILAAVCLLLAAAILALGTAVVFPFEMDTIVTLSHGRLVATHYGLYNTVCGVGILLGNLGTGWALDLARSAGAAAAPWAVLIIIGVFSAAALAMLQRRGLLTPQPVPAEPCDAQPSNNDMGRPETLSDAGDLGSRTAHLAPAARYLDAPTTSRYGGPWFPEGLTQPLPIRYVPVAPQPAQRLSVPSPALPQVPPRAHPVLRAQPQGASAGGRPAGSAPGRSSFSVEPLSREGESRLVIADGGGPASDTGFGGGAFGFEEDRRPAALFDPTYQLLAEEASGRARLL